MKIRKIILHFFIFGTFIFYIYNLINFQFSKEGAFYKEMAKKQFFIKRIIQGKRGTIYDRKSKILAVSLREGNEWKRVYPYGEICAPFIGIVGKDGRGLEGIEYYYDRVLSGEKGFQVLYRTRNGKLVNLPDFKNKEPKDGKDIILTIDVDLQEISYKNLKECIRENNAKRGFVIIMNPKTGEILTCVSYPSFDPHKIPNNFLPDWRALPITYLYEPGSVFKIVTYGAFIKERLYNKFQQIDITPGSLIIRGLEIHDPEPHLRKKNLVLPSEVIVYSSNIGISKIALLLPPKKIYETALLMGFGVKTGIDFPGEESGKLKDYREWDEHYQANFSFGQGVFVNGLQIALAYAIIANGGYLLEPFILKEVIDGEKLKVRNYPKIIRKVFNDEEIRIIKNTLRMVVEEGTGRNAKIPGISVCGKTGTAQKFDVYERKYDMDKGIMSFVGFFPEEDPEYLIYIMIDEPEKGRFASEIVAPYFKKIVQEMLPLIKPLKEFEKSLIARNEIE